MQPAAVEAVRVAAGSSSALVRIRTVQPMTVFNLMTGLPAHGAFSPQALLCCHAVLQGTGRW